ncbi:MAG: VOC family protein [Chloroflexi bacterium]|nr:VOC family protein [Chloroflexota bacterium]
MTETSSATATPTYAPGTPMWIDHTSKDVQAAAKFYGQLFGWQAQDMGEEAGHYTMFTLNGKQVAATTPPMSPDAPPAWTTYIATDNAAATAEKVKAAGGQVLVEPFAVMDQGSMGVFVDPTGAVFCVWQAAAHKGAEIANQPGSFCWNELETRDLPKAKDFYSKVFGYGLHANAMPGGGEYVELQVNGRSVAGAQDMSSMQPAQVPPHWLVYFAVANTDDTVKKAQQLGGKVMSPAMDIPQGRMAVLTDPEGAAFAIIQLSAQ